MGDKKNQENDPFVQFFTFQTDTTKAGRVLSTAKIGDIYMSRLVIEPKVVTGNMYHKKMRIMFYVEQGKVTAIFEHTKTKERKEIDLIAGKHVVHVPPLVGLATKNVGKSNAVLVFFSTKRLRSPDDTFDYLLLD